jgi:DNA polymerase-1
MQKAFAEGKDLHKLTATVLTGKDYDEITKEERQRAKAVNFGLLYGMGAESLQKYAYTNYGVDMNLEEAEEIREKFFQHYQGLARWHEKTAEKLLRTNVLNVKTLLGRVCAASGFTNALNYPVQGSGADLLKLSCVRFKNLCEKKGIDAKIINLVHDEIVVEVDTDKAKETAKLLKEAMESSCNDLFKTFKTEVEIELIQSSLEVCKV